MVSTVSWLQEDLYGALSEEMLLGEDTMGGGMRIVGIVSVPVS